MHKELGLSLSGDELSRCAEEPSCLQVWTTARVLMNEVVRITDVIGSWNMTENGVGNVCHVNAGKDVAFCHIPSDVYKSGTSWLALGVPVDAPNQKPLPVAVRCHDMGPSNHNPPCHLLAGNEFMAARLENIDTQMQVMQRQSQGSVKTMAPTVVSLGWHEASPVSVTIMGDGKCLDVGGGEAVDGAPVQLWTCLGNNNQIWERAFVPWADSIGFYGASHKPTHCLDVPGANLVAGQEMWLWDCGSNFGTQDWLLDARVAINADRPTQLKLTIDDQQWCLERTNLDDGSRPTIQTCNGSPQQDWNIIRNSMLV